MDGDIVGLAIPRWLCRSCRGQLDEIVIVTADGTLATRIVRCVECGAERSRYDVALGPRDCRGCGWQGPLVVVEWPAYRSAPLCLTCRLDLRGVLRQIRQPYRSEAA